MRRNGLCLGYRTALPLAVLLCACTSYQTTTSRMETTAGADIGVPVAERTQGNHTYLYFRNGCEVTCGTFDVVFLDDDQVVDAIVRGQGHSYSGVSSSPTARTPQDARPGAGPGE